VCTGSVHASLSCDAHASGTDLESRTAEALRLLLAKAGGGFEAAGGMPALLLARTKMMPKVRNSVEPRKTVATSTIVQMTDRWDASSSASAVELPRVFVVNCTAPVEITGAGVARSRQQVQLGSQRPAKLLRQSLGREPPTSIRHSWSSDTPPATTASLVVVVKATVVPAPPGSESDVLVVPTAVVAAQVGLMQTSYAVGMERFTQSALPARGHLYNWQVRTQ